VLEGYRRGQFGLIDLLDARRSLVHSRLQYIDALQAVWIARAELRRFVGEPLMEMEGVTK
jgi:outer membrane protein TolC